MFQKEEIRSSSTKFEEFLLNKLVIIGLAVIFSITFLFQLFFADIDEYFIAEILRFKPLRPILDPFWLVMFWPTVAIFFLSITVFFVFSNKRSIALAMLAIVVLGGLFLGDALKSLFGLFGLGRPAQSLSAWVPELYSSFLPTTSETSDFPGQSILVPAAFCVYFYLRKPKKWKAILFIVYNGLMLFARPYIGINHISANIGGLIIGLYFGLIVFKYKDAVARSSLFNTKLKKCLIALSVFGLMFLIYWIQRPVFVNKPTQGVDLDIRMFMMVFGGFLGLSLTDYPKELNFRLNTTGKKLAYSFSIVFSYVILFALYSGALILPENLLWLGIIIGFIDGLWIAVGGPMIVGYLNKKSIST
jgi:hypothetical protein